MFATINYWRGKLINWRVGLPVLVTAVILSPIGARLTASVDKTMLLGMFAAFLVFAGFMMLFYRAKKREQPLSRPVEIGAGAGVGTVAGFLGGLLGVGGGNFILPVLNWLGLDAKVAAGTTALVVVFSSFSGFLGHATLGGLDPAFHGNYGGDGGGRLDRRFAVDEDQSIQHAAQENHRRFALGDRRQNDFRCTQIRKIK